MYIYNLYIYCWLWRQYYEHLYGNEDTHTNICLYTKIYVYIYSWLLRHFNEYLYGNEDTHKNVYSFEYHYSRICILIYIRWRNFHGFSLEYFNGRNAQFHEETVKIFRGRLWHLRKIRFLIVSFFPGEIVAGKNRVQGDFCCTLPALHLNLWHVLLGHKTLTCPQHSQKWAPNLSYTVHWVQGGEDP